MTCSNTLNDNDLTKLGPFPVLTRIGGLESPNGYHERLLPELVRDMIYTCKLPKFISYQMI